MGGTPAGLPIKGQRRGTYWLTYFRLDSGKLGDLRRQCQITDDIVRVLFLKVDPRIVDALVDHARSAPVVTHTDEGRSRDDEPDEIVVPVVDAVEGVVDDA